MARYQLRDLGYGVEIIRTSGDLVDSIAFMQGDDAAQIQDEMADLWDDTNCLSYAEQVEIEQNILSQYNYVAIEDCGRSSSELLDAEY